MISEHGISAETTCRHKVYGTISKYSRAMLCRARLMRLQSIGACLLVIALLLGEHAATSAGAENELTGPSAARPQTTYRGGLVTPPLAKPNFTLTDTAGAPFAFLEMTQGNVTLLFFGYPLPGSVSTPYGEHRCEPEEHVGTARPRRGPRSALAARRTRSSPRSGA